MSALTKVFVILVAIFSVMLVAVVVTFVVNQENFRVALDNAKADALMAKSAAKTRQGELEAHQDQVAVQRDRLQQRARSLQAQLVHKGEEAAQARVNAISSKRDITRLQARNDHLAVGQRILSETTQQQRNELLALRTEINRVRAELILTTDRLAGQTTEKEALIRNLRAKKEELEAITNEYDKLWALAKEHGWTPDEQAVSTGAVRSQTRIDGMVMAVESTESGDTYVQVNIGQNDGVLPNMEFVVYKRDKHGAQYKGTMLVELVDAAESSAKMRITQEGQQIVKGDLIISGHSSSW